ncbi:putative histidine kinase group protein [Sordaria brevicollis]|uniref:Histidine kinase group protein n=1 Tax=Sordaria brevicollis TaxID=83679 RepID=A0AAE0PEP1_SORBR|nr:putative histidine kinase group protein [Sordaria brevicollis]
MAKKKKAAPAEDKASEVQSPAVPATQDPSSGSGSGSGSKKTTAKTKASSMPPQQQPSPVPALIICRNKHWRYISSFHGPWLQLPPEILETLANLNYNTPRPRPIDPSVFFDLVKIRRLVDDATNLAVRAASGVATVSQHNMSGGPHHALGLFGPGGQTKLSRERKHRMREQATQKLSKAYHLDEIASSVATMQSASPLEEVASLVLQRNPQDADAKYVHFFHEKIPSRQLAQCTNLDSLSEIISEKSSLGEPLRTRATVRIFKEDFEGAIADLTEALRIHRFYRLSQNAPKNHNQPQPRPGGRRQEDVVLKEEEQPNSLEIQLLFQRAGVYLTIACQHVAAAFPSKSATARSANGDAPDQGGKTCPGATSQDIPEWTTAELEAGKRMMEARKLVRHNAKRALKDYMNYLSHFEYSPDLPIEIAEDFARKVNYAANGVRVPRSFAHGARSDSPVTGEPGESQPTHRIYALSDLFAASPPADLPQYPSTELTPVRPQQQQPTFAAYQTTTETLTYHPLMNDALHALLLCHCLIQTSAKELLRHAYMVARLARLADGYPIFQASRSPARADWTEVLRASGNFIQLAGTWEDLCAPAPLPLFQPSGPGGGPVPVALPAPIRQPKTLPPPMAGGPAESGALVHSSSSNGTNAAAEAEKQRKERIQHQAILDALGDDRIKDEASFRMAVKARQLRAENDYRLDNAVAAMDAKLTGRDFDALALEAPPSPKDTATATNGSLSTALTHNTSTANGTTGTNGVNKPSTGTTNGGTTAQPQQNIRRWSVDDGKEYPISTDRASAIARWVLEAPPVTSAGGDGAAARRRKKKVVSKRTSGTVPAVVGVGFGAGCVGTAEA